MSSSGGADGASVLPKVGGGALKWLQKAGDLLDKLDKTAADTIAADDDDEEVARILGMDEEAEEGGWEEHEEGGDREGASHSSEGVRGEPQPAGRASKDSSERAKSERKLLEAKLRKKEAQVAKLIQAHKDLTRAAAERESSLQRAISALEERARVSEADATKARSELADARGRLEDVARQLNGSRESATQARNALLAERDEANKELHAASQSLAHSEEQLRVEQERTASLVRSLDEAKAEAEILRAREEVMSRASVESTVELASAQRGREESDRTARRAADELHQARERLAEAESAAAGREASLGDAERRAGELEREVLGLRDEVSRSRAEAAAARLALSSQPSAPAPPRRQAYQQPQASESELTAQLTKMVDRLEHKQTALESALSEKSAVEARLESECARTRDLQLQLGAWHGPQITDVESLMPRSVVSSRVRRREWTAEVKQIVAMRDPVAAWKLLDEVCQRASVAIAQDTTVRVLVVGYLLLLQFSAFTVLVHALVGKHHH